MYIMVKHLATDLLGLEAGRIRKQKKRVIVDGKKKQVFIGVFRFAPPKHEIFELNKETEKMEVTETIPLHVLDVARQDWLEPEMKPSDWFNDSGITSEEEECEGI